MKTFASLGMAILATLLLLSCEGSASVDEPPGSDDAKVLAPGGAEAQPLSECGPVTYTNTIPASSTFMCALNPAAGVTSPSPGTTGAPSAILRGVADKDEPAKLWDVYANLTYGIRGGRVLQGDLWIPTWTTGTTGLILGIHGGGWQQCDRRRDAVEDVVRTLARRSNAAFFNVEYRLSQEGGWYPNNLLDVKCSLQFALAKAIQFPTILRIDPARVAVVGESAGATLAAMIALTENRDDLNPRCSDGLVPSQAPKVRAVFAFSPVADLPALAASSSPARQSPQEYTAGACSIAAPVNAATCGGCNPNRCVDASPLQHACRLPASSTLYLIHAPRHVTTGVEYDAVIPLGQSQALADAIQAAGSSNVALWVPSSTYVEAYGCRADNQIAHSAHGFSPCLVGPLLPLLDLALQGSLQ